MSTNSLRSISSKIHHNWSFPSHYIILKAATFQTTTWVRTYQIRTKIQFSESREHLLIMAKYTAKMQLQILFRVRKKFYLMVTVLMLAPTSNKSMWTLDPEGLPVTSTTEQTLELVLIVNRFLQLELLPKGLALRHPLFIIINSNSIPSSRKLNILLVPLLLTKKIVSIQL
jgi:hypothetical protein